MVIIYPMVDVDLYTAIAMQIKNKNMVKTEVVTM